MAPEPLENGDIAVHEVVRGGSRYLRRPTEATLQLVAQSGHRVERDLGHKKHTDDRVSTGTCH